MGFTLLELTVVILVLTVVLGLVLPRLSFSLLGDEMTAATRKMVAAVAEARAQAMIEGRIWSLVVVPGRADFWLLPEKGAAEQELQPPERAHRLGDEVRFLDVIKAERVLAGGRVFLRFLPTGLGEPGIIHLRATDGRVASLVIKPFNGRVLVEDGYLATLPGAAADEQAFGAT